MTVQVFVLLGGVMDQLGPLPAGWDGVVDSVGMLQLAGRLATIPGVKVTSKDWGQYAQLLPLIAGVSSADKIAVIGFSGGGSRATWLANSNDGKGWPPIDLLVAYDPSPTWNMTALHANVKKAICYHNLHPLMPSIYGPLGGGQFIAAPHWGCGTILTRQISEQHLAVQFNPGLHAATEEAVKELLTP